MEMVFTIYSFHLAIHGIFVEKRLLEELREDVKGFSELLVCHVEVKVSVVISCRSVGVSSILFQELLVLILVRIFFGSQKEHVLAKVGQTINSWHLSILRSFWITQVS